MVEGWGSQISDRNQPPAKVSQTLQSCLKGCTNSTCSRQALELGVGGRAARAQQGEHDRPGPHGRVLSHETGEASNQAWADHHLWTIPKKRGPSGMLHFREYTGAQGSVLPQQLPNKGEFCSGFALEKSCFSFLPSVGFEASSQLNHSSSSKPQHSYLGALSSQNVARHWGARASGSGGLPNRPSSTTSH